MIISGGAGAQLPPQAMEQALQTKQQFDLHGLHFDSDMATSQPGSRSTWVGGLLGGSDLFQRRKQK